MVIQFSVFLHSLFFVSLSYRQNPNAKEGCDLSRALSHFSPLNCIGASFAGPGERTKAPQIAAFYSVCFFWKLKLETEGEAEAEGSFYALLQKYLEISCRKTRIRGRKWHPWWHPFIAFAICCIRYFFVSLSRTKRQGYRRMRLRTTSLA